MGVSKTILEGKIKIGSDVSEAISGFKTLEKTLQKLDLGKGFNDKISNLFNKLTQSGEKMSDAIASGFKNKSDVTRYNTALQEMESALRGIKKEVSNIDANKIHWSNSDIEKFEKQLNDLKNTAQKLKNEFKDTNIFKEFQQLMSAPRAAKNSKSFFAAFESGDIERMKAAASAIQSIADRTKVGTESNQFWIAAAKQANEVIDQYAKTMGTNLADQLETTNKLTTEQANELEAAILSWTKFRGEVDSASDALLKNGQNMQKTAESTSELNQSLDRFKQKATYFFGMENAVRLFRRAVRAAFNDVKELDQVMTQTAVVTDFSVGDLWSQLPDYTKRANALGVSIKSAYEAATLFYQQGLKTEQVVAVSTETLKMARIAGLDAATATDRMTNALRGFNMEINEVNAQRINDVYSKLAAITASDVDEISTAMTKVASLANNANMSFEKTAAFLSQIIETTRESAETAGTALKTVVARFSEVKELYTKGQLLGTDEEGEEIHVNRVSKALATAGINLNEYLSGMKGLDDIFIELASKWDDLDEVQQRYIATMAAGSRQQSRFIALMQDYDRTLQLVDAAENATGASTEQFNKTLDSMDAKLEKLKNSWTTFTTSITDAGLIKFFVDFGRVIIDVVNNITKLLGPLKGLSSSLALFGGLKLGKKIVLNMAADIGMALQGQADMAAKQFGARFLTAFSKLKLAPSAIKGFFKSVDFSESFKSYKTMVDSLSRSLAHCKEGTEKFKIVTDQLNSSTKALNTIKASGLTYQEKAIFLQAMETDEDLRNTVATKKMTAAKLRELAAEKGLNLEKGKSIGLRIKEKIATLGGANAQELSALVTKKSTIAQDGLNAALKRGTIMVGLYTGAIIAATAAIAVFVTAWKDFDASASRAREAAESLTQATSDLRNTTEDLTDKSQALFDVYDKQKELLKGTEAWNDNLKDINDQVKNLIDKYPQFARYFEKDSEGNWQAKPEAKEAIQKTINTTTNQENLAHGASQIANAFASYKEAEADINKQGLWKGGLIGAGMVIAPGLLTPVAQAVNDDLNNQLNKKWSEAKNTAMEGYNAALNFLGEDGGYAELLIEDATYAEKVFNNLDKLKAHASNNYAKWDKATKEAYSKFKSENYQGARINDKGEIIQANGKKVDYAWELFANWQTQQEYQTIIDNAKKDRSYNLILDALLNQNITEAQYKMLTNEYIKGLDEGYQDLAYTIRQRMVDLGDALWKNGFSSDFINDLDLQTRDTIAKTVTKIPEGMREEFTNILSTFWETLDEESKKQVATALQGTDFTDMAKLHNLNETLNEVLSENGNVDNFISSLETLGIATKAMVGSAEALVDQFTTISGLIKDKAKTLTKDQYEKITSDKIKSLIVKTAPGEYSVWASQEQLEKTGIDAALEAVREKYIAAKNAKATGATVDTTDLDTTILQYLGTGDVNLIEAIINSDAWKGWITSPVNQEKASQYLSASINQNPAAFGLNTTVKSGLHWGQYANIIENRDKTEDIKKTFDALNNLSYFLKSGPIHDYSLVYSEVSDLMTTLFGSGNNAKWINDHTELLLDLLDNTENYEEVLAEFRGQLLRTSPFNLKDILAEGEETSWGEYIINTTEDINELAAAFDKAGYSATILDDGTLGIIDTLGKYLRNNFLSGKYGSGSGSGDDGWENPYDRLHNLLEHITAMQKSRNYLERQYTKELRNQEGSIQKTTELMTKRLENLQGERELQAKLAEERQKDLDNYYRAHADEVSGYAYYQNGRVYIDWDAIERDKGTMSKEEGKNLEDVINKLKGYTDSRDDATDKLDEIDQEIYDTHQTIIENYRNFEDRVLAAITADQQKRIDMMSKIDDSINDATDKLFDQAQKQIDEYRQTRENEKTESEIADKEARLAYLRRDTSGANALEIKKLEEELGDARQDYADSRIDQALEEMKNEADLAAEQRAEQIAIEQGILDYQKEMGYFWPRVSNLINSAFNSDKTVNWNSQLIDLLKETEGFKGLSELGKSEWIKQTNSAMLNLLDEETLRRILYGSDPNRTVLDETDVASGVNSGENQYGVAKDSSLQAFTNKTEYQNELQTLSTFIAGFKEVGEGIYGTDIPNKVKYYVQQYSTVFNQAEAMLSALSNSNFYGKDRIIRELKTQMNQWVDEYNNYLRLLGWDFAAKEHYATGGYATGGLADFTGPAWLDGSRSHPEYVLNAAQTEGFLQLVDMFTKPQDAFSGAPGSGDNYFDIDINAEIGSDYDVDQLVERIKTKITEDSMYRNVNAISFIR